MLIYLCSCTAAYLFPSSLSPEILEGLLGSGLSYHQSFELDFGSGKRESSLLCSLILSSSENLLTLNLCLKFLVGGVMAFLTLHEMLPLAFDYAGQKQAVKAVFFGMAFMSAR